MDHLFEEISAKVNDLLLEQGSDRFRGYPQRLFESLSESIIVSCSRQKKHSSPSCACSVLYSLYVQLYLQLHRSEKGLISKR